MKKTKSTRNYLAMAYRIDAVPGGRVRKRDFFHTLLDFLDGEIEELPDGWEITWRWQNSKKQKWREDEFTSTVSNSDKKRGGFITLMRRRLQRDLDKLSPAKRAPAKRKKRKTRTRKAGNKRKAIRKVSKVRKEKSRRGKARKRHNRA